MPCELKWRLQQLSGLLPIQLCAVSWILFLLELLFFPRSQPDEPSPYAYVHFSVNSHWARKYQNHRNVSTGILRKMNRFNDGFIGSEGVGGRRRLEPFCGITRPTPVSMARGRKMCLA